MARKLTRFGLEVKKALLERGMTQKELGESLGIPPNRFSEIIAGARRGERWQRQRERIARALGIECPGPEQAAS